MAVAKNERQSETVVPTRKVMTIGLPSDVLKRIDHTAARLGVTRAAFVILASAKAVDEAAKLSREAGNGIEQS